VFLLMIVSQARISPTPRGDPAWRLFQTEILFGPLDPDAECFEGRGFHFSGSPEVRKMSAPAAGIFQRLILFINAAAGSMNIVSRQRKSCSTGRIAGVVRAGQQQCAKSL